MEVLVVEITQEELVVLEFQDKDLQRELAEVETQVLVVEVQVE
jgi:hypothetical protein